MLMGEKWEKPRRESGADAARMGEEIIMTMRIGVCTTDFENAMPAGELFDKIAGMGFETVQLAFASVSECGFVPSAQVEIPEYIPMRAIRAIRRAARDSGLSVGAVNGTWNMAHPDRGTREEGVRRMEGFLAATADLGCPIASLCSGTRSRTYLWRYDAANGAPDAWSDMRRSMERSARLAEKYGVTLAIETEASNVIDSPEKARRILNEVSSPRLKMILDAANLFHAGEAREETMRPRIDRAMECFGRDIVLAHGKDIRPSDGIAFCGTGFGIVDFPYMLKRLAEAGYQGDMMLHGIYREEDMPGCRQFMADCLRGQAPARP